MFDIRYDRLWLQLYMYHGMYLYRYLGICLYLRPNLYVIAAATATATALGSYPMVILLLLR